MAIDGRDADAFEGVAETAEGLEDVAAAEMAEALGLRAGPGLSGELPFRWRGDPRRLLALRTVQAVWARAAFDAPRPKALLGDAHFRRLAGVAAAALDLWPPGAFRTLRLAAAGADSAVMVRLRDALAARLELAPSSAEGDLLIRLRPAAGAGWEALVRLSPRPLATRAWRVRDYPGALNAAVAAAMIRLVRPAPGDAFANPFCGSGTLLIERLAWGRPAMAVGIDVASAPLALAHDNLAAAGARAALLQSNATGLPFTDACFPTLCMDLPFGRLTGSHQENIDIYPAALAEAARVATVGARLAAITHEARLMAAVVEASPDWETLETRRIHLNGIHPRIWILRRREKRGGASFVARSSGRMTGRVGVPPAISR